ncbi:MAG: peptidoglycan editing factor PgeF [Anaerolineae bacterium]|nr:peptidoglycan editing factor PgeF [Anaerolineae bacterium]
MSQQFIDPVYPVSLNKVRLYRVRAFDDYPGLTHAIFTRHGGISQAPYRSLNLGSTVGDNADAVKTNFEQICRAANIRPDQTVSVYQVHSADILTVNQANRQPVMGRADGLITAERDIFLLLRFADCTPLLFFDPVRQAVGLAHAGWRGTVKNAAGATVDAMVKQLDCAPENIIAVIGPAIGPCCYQVGIEVMNAVAENFVEVDSLLTRHNGAIDHAHFDLWAANRRQLAAQRVQQIIQSNLCTACRTDMFFSHRAEQGRTGRFGVMIGLRGEAG